MTRKCYHCKQIKNIKEFYSDKNKKQGRSYKCKKCDNVLSTACKNKSPWRKHLQALRKRCNNAKCDSFKYYGGKGVKALISLLEIKELWFRDKAYNLKKPSIDRKESNKNYTLNNCRFIEFGENSSLSNIQMARKIHQLTVNGFFVKEWISAKDIENRTGFLASYIRANCRKKTETAYGFIWEYKKEK